MILEYLSGSDVITRVRPYTGEAAEDYEEGALSQGMRAASRS